MRAFAMRLTKKEMEEIQAKWKEEERAHHFRTVLGIIGAVLIVGLALLFMFGTVGCTNLRKTSTVDAENQIRSHYGVKPASLTSPK